MKNYECRMSNQSIPSFISGITTVLSDFHPRATFNGQWFWLLWGNEEICCALKFMGMP